MMWPSRWTVSESMPDLLANSVRHFCGRSALAQLRTLESPACRYSSPQGLPRRHRWQRRVRRDGGVEPDPPGHRRRDARRRDEVRPQQVLDARPPVGSARAKGEGREGTAVLPRHEGAALPHARGEALRADSRLGTRRQDECLGTRQPALLRSRLQGRREGRLGDPLAYRIQRHLAVLRQGRSADRRLRRRR